MPRERELSGGDRMRRVMWNLAGPACVVLALVVGMGYGFLLGVAG